ncbi:MAG: hypothetical protein WD696_04250 [Bryobacteraceae bacterium]
MKGGRLATLAIGLLTVTALASKGHGAPALTLIQDVLYKADGTRMSGLLTISWNSFEASDGSNVSAQSISVAITEGRLRVQLVPTSDAATSAYYSVRYNSDGKVQFEETWVVPPATVALRVRDVRANVLPAPGTGTPGSIQKADVVGLVEDLNARPVKGPGYAPSRVLMVSAAGELESVVGDASGCVRADGTVAPCGPAFTDGETPAGVVDGGNATFQLAAAPEPISSLAVYRNGLMQRRDFDYGVASNQIVFVPEAVPQPGDTLVVSYRRGGDSAVPPGTGLFNSEVICSAPGSATSSSAPTSLGTCNIPAASLHAGDRFEIRFEFSHQGAATGFTLRVTWDGVVLADRTAAADETAITGRGDAAIHGSGVRLSAQSWGATSAFAVGLADASAPGQSGVPIDFQAQVDGATADTVRLEQFTVVRYPAR